MPYVPSWSSDPTVFTGFNVVGGSTYAASCNDQVLYVNATTTVTLPGFCANNKSLRVYNNGNGVVTFAAASGNVGSLTLSSGQAASVMYSTGYNQWLILDTNSVGADPTLLRSLGVLGGSTYSIACTDQVLFSNGAMALTLPSGCGAGKSYLIRNIASSGVTTFTSPGGGSATSLTLGPGEGAFITQYNNSNQWYTVLESNPVANSAGVSFALGSAAGTGGSVACAPGIVCSAKAGRVQVTVGSSPVAGYLIGVTDATGWSGTQHCVATQNQGSAFYGIGVQVESSSFFEVASSVVAAPGTVMTVDYACTAP